VAIQPTADGQARQRSKFAGRPGAERTESAILIVCVPSLTDTAACLPPGEPPDLADHIAASLADRGWCVSDDFVPPLLVSQLRHEAHERWQSGDFRPAGVGRGEDRQLRPDVRTDRVDWLDPAALSAAQHLYWNALEQVRLAVNRTMFLGLYDFEAHLAVYPPGSRYRRHLDQFLGIGRRHLTCILYLNDRWNDADGGQLRIYTDPDDPDACEELLPLGGRLVTFLSARFLHEVLPARRERFSLTGWFRRRG